MVIDASAVLAVLLGEPERPALIDATIGADLVAPASLPLEVGNALVAAVRRRRLTPVEARQAWESYNAVPVRLLDVDVGRAIDTATELGLYAYDAYVLDLARARRLPLLTLDKRLRSAAESVHVTLVEYAR
jgi:predicted nucleic acid-binding protein